MNIYMRTNAKIKSGDVTAYYILSAETPKGEATFTKRLAAAALILRETHG